MGYWEERNTKTQKNLTTRNIKEAEKQLIKYYQKSMKKVLDDFEQTYTKLLSLMDEGKTPSPSDLYKLDKYWQLQAQLKTELTKLGDKEVALFSKRFVSQYKDIYEAVALKGEDHFNKYNPEVAQQMINEIWCADGENWSQRIWKKTDALQQSLNDELLNCLLVGDKPGDLKKKLMSRFGVAYNRADCIVRTEMSHIQAQAAQKRYADYGIKEVEVLVDADERTCPHCKSLEGKKYPIFGKMPVPAHPNCRCSLIPVVE